MAKKKAAPIVLRTRITGMQFLKGKDLQDHFGNFRTHPQHQREALGGVLRDIGIAGALLVYQSERQGGLTVIDGHLRKGDYPAQEWPCLMTDLDDAEADYMLLMHDELGRQAEREKVAMQALMERVKSGEAGVQALMGLMADELGILLDQVHGHGTLDDIPEPEIDRAEELREKWGVEVGQLWQLGRHRVLCGDCTDKAVVEHLMGEFKAALVLTSPPYAVGKDYEQGTTFAEHLALLRGCADRCLEVVIPGGFLFINFDEIAPQSHASPMTGSDRQCLYPISKDYWQIFHEERRCDLYAQRIWYKPFNRLQQPFWTYHTSIPHHQEWEHLWTWRTPGGDPDTVYDWDVSVRAVWDTRTDATNDKPLTRHSAAFPVDIPEKALRAHSAPGAMVYDPFLGSGTTLVVCEQMDRTCYGCELAPASVAITLQRWADMTGETPQLLTE